MELSSFGNKNEGSEKLLEVTLPLKTNEECQSIYSRRVKISPKQICAGGEMGKGRDMYLTYNKGDADSCSGDSGGGLLGLQTVQSEPHKRTKYFQIGIVSFGPVQCGAVNGLPGVYTRLSGYLEWILDNISL